MANRYNKQIKLAQLGHDGQQKLALAKVLVVGAGGLGVPVLQYLTGMGIGTIGIIDGDTINLDNLHRQVLYDETVIGKLKADVAAEKLKLLNSDVKLIIYPQFLTVANAAAIITGYDIVVDASDNLGTRYLINDVCVMLKKPFVYGAVQHFEGHIAVFNLNDGPTYRCLYPTPPAPNEIPDCDDAGVLGVAPGIIGSLQALQVIKVLAGFDDTLSGHLLVVDLLRDEQHKIKLKTEQKNKAIASLQSSYDTPCSAAETTMNVTELAHWYTSGRQFLLVDVREPKEFETEHLCFAHSYPLSSIKDQVSKLPKDIPLVIICEIGGRSHRVANIIREFLPGASVQNVAGGIEAWFDEFGDEWVVYPENAAK